MRIRARAGVLVLFHDVITARLEREELQYHVQLAGELCFQILELHVQDAAIDTKWVGKLNDTNGRILEAFGRTYRVIGRDLTRPRDQRQAETG